ncbi:hypothetical protein F8R89_23610 [Streptomyces sp. SS1-1]|uniref:hypothetical protein n=1 Tax=Streptomyces sp. SS1-1 TaxID=2651869 RepID=UPI00124F8B7B|nr:hypothetical protein [Streptomyces sp. SS1-1]KAB2974715.1 hypothetical protein F8R89_23610 [Streptomyces sp. SS1-1]
MTGRRRLWRWIVAAWLVLAAVAGGVTLWLRDAAGPPGPYRWENATSPTPPPECTPPEPGEDTLCFVRSR